MGKPQHEHFFFFAGIFKRTADQREESTLNGLYTSSVFLSFPHRQADKEQTRPNSGPEETNVPLSRRSTPTLHDIALHNGIIKTKDCVPLPASHSSSCMQMRISFPFLLLGEPFVHQLGKTACLAHLHKLRPFSHTQIETAHLIEYLFFV